MSVYLETVAIPLVAAAASARRPVFFPPAGQTYRIKAIRYAISTTTAANGTNYVSVRPYKGASTALAAARTTASTALTASQVAAEDVTLTASGVDLEISSSGGLSFDITHASSGAALDIVALVDFERVKVSA